MLSEINSEEDIFNKKREILKKKLLLEDEIDSLTKDQLALNGKGDLSASLKLKDQIKKLKKDLNSVNKTLENFESIKYFLKYHQSFLDNLSSEEISTFLKFNKECCISVTSDIFETGSEFSNINDIIFSIGKSLKTSLSTSQSQSIIKKLSSNFEEDKNNKIYVTLCYIKFEEYYAPLLFIPVIIDNSNDNKIFRDNDNDILYNDILKNKLAQHGIALPNFEASFKNFIVNLKNIDEITFCEDIFICNCNLIKILINNDLNEDKWANFQSKFNILLKTEGYYSVNNVLNINNDIVREHRDYNLNLNISNLDEQPHVLIKNLLSKNNSILYISENSDIIKDLLVNSNLGPLMLDLNKNTDIISFKNQINEKLFKYNNMNRADTYREKSILNHLIHVLKAPFLNFQLLPMEIKEKLDYYTKMRGSQIEVSFNNISDYDLNYFDQVNAELLDLISKSDEISNFKHYFRNKLPLSNFKLLNEYLDNLNENIDEFISFNKILNKKLKLKLFNNLELVNYLTNLNVLTKSYQYIDVEDRLILNEYIKHYEKNIDNEYSDNVDALSDFINNLSNFKPKLFKFNEDLKDLIEFFNENNNDKVNSLYNLHLDLKESIINLNELNRYIDLNNNFDEIKAEINSFNKKFGSIHSKYFESDEDIYETLENNIKFTELIDYNIIEDEPLIKFKLSDEYDNIENLYQCYKNILSQINDIHQFYQKHESLEVPNELFNKNTSFDDLKSIIYDIKMEFYLYNQFNNKNYNNLVKLFMDLYLDGSVKKEDISNVLYYNVYNEIYKEFLNRYPEFLNKNLDYRAYEHKLEEITISERKYKYNKLMYDIYKTPQELVVKTKNEKLLLNKEIEDNELKNIEIALTNFKDCIMANKRIFILNYESVIRYLSNSYENTFNYVILDNSKNISNFELLSLLLRSKNKIIKLE